MTLYLYVTCTADNKCKIGRTRKYARRLQAIQAGCPERLTLRFLIPLEGAGALETYLHRFFKNQQKYLWGEWFQLTEDDLNALPETCLDLESEPPEAPAYLAAAASWYGVSPEYVKGLKPVNMDSDTFEQDILDRHLTRVRGGYSY